MIREIKFVNLFAIGNKVIIKYRFEDGLGSYADNGGFSIKILYKGNIISPKKIKKIDNKVIRVDYYFNESKKLIMDLINYGMKVIITCNTLNQEFEIKNIDENKVYTNIIKRINESKKYNDIMDKTSKLFLGKEDYKFYSKLRKDKNFRRDVMYTKAYEEEKIDENIILYESYAGRIMSCSPYAIFKYLLNNNEYKDFKHIWVLNDSSNCKDLYKNMDNIEFVKIHSDDYIKYLAKAKYLINNSTFPPYYIRKEGQIYLNTWHGTPIKTLGKLEKGSRGLHKNVQRNLLQATHLIHPNKFTADIMIKENDIDGIYEGKVFDCGYPRVDLTFNSDKKEIKKILNLKRNKKIILYAPTWRGVATWRGEGGSIDNEIDKFIEDYEYLLNKVGDEYIILLRVHYFMTSRLIEKGYGEFIVDNCIDTNELLSVVDILISDYSSIIFDFMPTKNPILLYCYDREKYADERGFILDLEELPGSICYTVNDLALKLLNIEDVIEENKEKYDIAIKKYNYNDDGKATERVVDFIFNNNLDGSYTVKNNKKNILMYCGGFLNNGITTSAINLLDNIDYDSYNVIVVDKRKYDSVCEFNISQLNSNVKIFYRSGNMLYLKDEMIKEADIFNNGLKKDITEEKEVSTLYKRDFKRLFSDVKFDIALDFSGYNKFWTLMMSVSDIDRKVIYQHNEMIKEYKKIVDGKQKHKKTMEVIFPLYNNFNKIVSVSKHTMEVNKEDFKPWVKEVDGKFDYIHNSINYKKVFDLCDQNNKIKIDDNYYQIKNYKVDCSGNISVEAFPKIDNSKTNFINIGRMSPEKDQKKLINAFSKVIEKYPDSRLYILGDGTLKKELNNLIISLGLQSHVILTGQVKNPFEIARECDCFVLSSNHEGQPMVLLEMLILNKDIIATDIPGNRSVLEGGYGLLCDNNEDALAKSMINYIENKNKFKKFDYEKYNKEAMDMFYKVIESK